MKRFRDKVGKKKKGKKREKQMVLDKQQGNGKGAQRRPDYLMV